MSVLPNTPFAPAPPAFSAGRIATLAGEHSLSLAAKACFAAVGGSVFFPWAFQSAKVLNDEIIVAAPPATVASPTVAYLVLILAVIAVTTVQSAKPSILRAGVVVVAAGLAAILLIIGAFTSGASPSLPGGGLLSRETDIDRLPSFVAVLAVLLAMLGAAALATNDLLLKPKDSQ